MITALLILIVLILLLGADSIWALLVVAGYLVFYAGIALIGFWIIASVFG